MIVNPIGYPLSLSITPLPRNCPSPGCQSGRLRPPSPVDAAPLLTSLQGLRPNRAQPCACRGDTSVRWKYFPLHSLRNSRSFMFQPRLRRTPVVALQQATQALAAHHQFAIAPPRATVLLRPLHVASHGEAMVADDAEGEAHQDRGQGSVQRPLRSVPDGGGRHPSRAVPGDPRTDSPPEAPIRSVQMISVSAEITQNARGQRRRSTHDRENAPSRAHGSGLRRCLEGSGRAWDAGKYLVETPQHGILAKIAGGGRQREVIWEISNPCAYI